MTPARKIKVVYIAANSFSGSTLLGILLGSDPKCFLVVKSINSYDEKTWRRSIHTTGAARVAKTSAM